MIIAQLSDFHVRPHGQPAYGIVDTKGNGVGQAEAARGLFDDRLWDKPVFLEDLQNIDRILCVSRR